MFSPQKLQCYFAPIPYCIDFLSLLQINFLPSFFHFLVCVTCRLLFPSLVSTPALLVHFYFPSFCDYFRLNTHTSRFGSQNHMREHSHFSVCVWATSLNLIFSTSNHLPGYFMISFIIVDQYFIMYMNYIFTVLSSTEGHLGCFLSLPIVNTASMHMAKYVSVGSSPLYICQGRVLVLWSNHFSFLLMFYTDFHRDYPSLQSQQQ